MDDTLVLVILTAAILIFTALTFCLQWIFRKRRRRFAPPVSAPAHNTAQAASPPPPPLPSLSGSVEPEIPPLEAYIREIAATRRYEPESTIPHSRSTLVRVGEADLIRESAKFSMPLGLKVAFDAEQDQGGDLLAARFEDDELQPSEIPILRAAQAEAKTRATKGERGLGDRSKVWITRIERFPDDEDRALHVRWAERRFSYVYGLHDLLRSETGSPSRAWSRLARRRGRSGLQALSKGRPWPPGIVSATVALLTKQEEFVGLGNCRGLVLGQRSSQQWWDPGTWQASFGENFALEPASGGNDMLSDDPLTHCVVRGFTEELLPRAKLENYDRRVHNLGMFIERPYLELQFLSLIDSDLSFEEFVRAWRGDEGRIPTSRPEFSQFISIPLAPGFIDGFWARMIGGDELTEVKKSDVELFTKWLSGTRKPAGTRTSVFHGNARLSTYAALWYATYSFRSR